MNSITTYRKHLVSLIEDEHLHRIGLEYSTLDHILNTAWRPHNDLGAILERLHIISYAGTPNASMAFNVHEITNSDNDFLDLLGKFACRSQNERLARLDIRIELLENGDRESGGLSGTRLGLCDNVRAWILLLDVG